MSATWNSGRLPMSITTRSPGPRRAPARPAAARVARSAYSSKVSGADVVADLLRAVGAPRRRPTRPTVSRNRAGNRCRARPRRHVIHNVEVENWPDPEWKTSPRWGRMAGSSSRGDRWGAATWRASLRRLSSGRTRVRAQRGTQRGRPRADRRACSAARAVVAGALVSVFLVPASAAVAQESSTTTSSSTTTTRTTPATTTTTAPRPTLDDPKPDPDAFAALANQVSQNQQMLTQLSAQVDAGDPAAGRARRRDRRHPAEARRHARRDGAAAADRARPCRVHLPARRHAQHRGRRHPARRRTSARRRSTRSRRRRPTPARSTACRRCRTSSTRSASSSKQSRASQQAGEGPAREREGTRSRHSPRTRRSCSTRPARSR